MSTEEFLFNYRKNNTNILDQKDRKTPEEYLGLYVNFRLKVLEAQKIGYDTVKSFVDELKGYRQELAKPYLTDVSYNEDMIKTAYHRTKYERKASHLLLLINPDASPEDTLAVWNKIADIRKKIIEGADFNEMDPLVFPDKQAEHVEEQVISAGHFHGMPLALAMSYLKAAIPVLASISERRLNKLVDPATNDGLPAFLIGNEDGTESGHMIVQYTAAAIVNDLASRAMPASVYSVPTSANAEDHVSMGANEARHVLAMAQDLGKVLGLELYTAAQALDLRRDMINAARELAGRSDADAFAAKVQGGPLPDAAERAGFLAEVEGLRAELAASPAFRTGRAVAAAHAAIRARIPFLDRDRAMDGEVAAAVRMVADGSVLAAARAVMQ